MGALPKNWEGCPKMASGLVGGIFFSFKTPLSPQLNNRLTEDMKFFPETAICGIKQFCDKEIGLWIDLTNTSRYYKKEVVEGYGIQYVKMAIEGHGLFPSSRQRRQFATLCDAFLKRCPGGVIGVHCTHGFNRTGFLIIYYLMYRQQYNVHTALSEFSSVRSPGIYRHNYVDELYDIFDKTFRSKSGDGLDLPPPHTHYVAAPFWKPGHKEPTNWRRTDVGGQGGQQSGSNCHQNRNIQHRQNPEERQYPEEKRFRFDEDEFDDQLGQFSSPNRIINGQEFFDKSLSHLVTPYNFGSGNKATLLRIVRHLCHLGQTGPLLPKPIKLQLDNLSQVTSEVGTVTWQSTGKQFLCFIQSPDLIFLIGEDESVWSIRGMNFPSKRNVSISTAQTVLVGEMTRINAGEKDIPAFIISDILCLMGKYVGRLSLTTRRRCLKAEIIQARAEAISRKLFSPSMEPFAIRSKPYFTLGDLPTLLNPAFQFRLSEPPTGLLFLHSTNPYQVGPLESGFQWTLPRDRKTVDFLLRVQKLDSLNGDLMVDDSNEPFSITEITEDMSKLNLDGKIITCTYANGKWVFIRETNGANVPQSFTIATDVQTEGPSSAEEKNSVSKEKLLSAISLLLLTASTTTA